VLHGVKESGMGRQTPSETQMLASQGPELHEAPIGSDPRAHEPSYWQVRALQISPSLQPAPRSTVCSQ
jgi:hypothetical protein